jgi:hypothetical protein
MGQHGITIPASQIDKWRPTTPTDGVVNGFEHLGDLTCIMTDGMQAYYITVFNKPWLGHIANFRWYEEVVSYVPYLLPNGEQRFFKSVKDSGAPPALYRRTPKPKTVNKSAKPKRPSPVEMALQALAKMVK